MRKLFYFEHSGPVFEHYLRHLVLTMLDESIKGQGTLIEVPRLLYDDDFRQAVIGRLVDPLARDFWLQYNKTNDFHRSENLAWIVSKFDTFTTDHIVRNIIGQTKSSVNISEIIAKKHILLVKLQGAVIGEVNAALLGMILLSKIRWAAMARAALPVSERTEYYLYVDEFQHFASTGFESILAEARKYRLSLVLAHQHIGQLRAFNISSGTMEDRATQAIFGNVGTIISFRLGVHDAKIIAEEMGPPVDPPDLKNLRNYHAIVKTLIGGEVYPPFTVQTLLGGPSESPGAAKSVTDMSITKYGRPRKAVDAEILSRATRLCGAGDEEDEVSLEVPVPEGGVAALDSPRKRPARQFRRRSPSPRPAAGS